MLTSTLQDYSYMLTSTLQDFSNMLTLTLQDYSYMLTTTSQHTSSTAVCPLSNPTGCCILHSVLTPQFLYFLVKIRYGK